MTYDLLAIKYQEQIFLGPDLTSWAPLNELNVHSVAILKWPNISKYHVLVSGCTSLKNNMVYIWFIYGLCMCHYKPL